MRRMLYEKVKGMARTISVNYLGMFSHLVCI
jgi:hypothetical protein